MDTRTPKNIWKSDNDVKHIQERSSPMTGAYSQHVDVDGVLRYLGNYGRYQMIQTFLHGLCYVAISYPIVTGMFIGKFVDFQCTETGTSFNISTLSTNQTIHFEECQVKVKDNSTSLVVFEETCTKHEYEGDDLFLSYIAEWDLECDKEVLGQLPQILLIGGQIFGACLITPFGDKFGRKKVVIIGVLLLDLMMLASALVQQFWLFLIVRFFNGAFIQTVLVPLCTMMLELVPIELKAWVSALQSFFWIFTLGLTGMIAYFLQDVDWRRLQLTYALVGGIPSILSLFFFDESLRWLVRNSRSKEADGILRKACRWNNKDYDTLMEKMASSSVNGFQELQSPEKTPSEEDCQPLDIVRNRNTRTITFVMCYIWCITALSFFGIILMSTSLAGDSYVNYFLTAIVEIPGGIVGYFLLDKLDRRPTMIFCNVGSAVALLLSVLVANVAPSTYVFEILQTCLTLVGQFFIILVFLIIWIYTPELYPTNLRSLGVGITSSAARVGSSFSPLFTILARKIPWIPGASFGGGCLISAFLMTLLPETRQINLPATLKDVDTMFEKKKKPIVLKQDESNGHLQLEENLKV